MWSYYELLTDFAWPVITRLREEVRTGVLHPMEAKMQLAHTIIAGFHGEEAAKKAAEEFQRVFRDRQAPERPNRVHIGELLGGAVNIKISGPSIVEISNYAVGPTGKARLSGLLVPLADISSKSEAERLIKQGGVEIDGVRVDDVRRELDLSRPGEFLLRAGKKKFLRIVVG